MMFPVIKEFLYLLIGFFRDINPFCFTLYREGEIVTMMKLSPLAFASLFPTRAAALSQGTFHHVGGFENLPQKLFFADGQRGNLLSANPITIRLYT